MRMAYTGKICGEYLCGRYAKKRLILGYIRYIMFLEGLFGLLKNLMTRGREMYKVKKNEEIKNKELFVRAKIGDIYV